MDEEARAGGAGAPEFLEDHDIEQIIKAKSAVFFRHGATQQPLGAGFQPEFARDDAVFLPLRVEGHDFAFDEAADRLPEYVVLFAE